MAEDSYQDRTEQPTPKRRAEAREKGQVARSRDLTAAVVLFSGLGCLLVAISPMAQKSADFMRLSLENLRPGQLTPSSFPRIFLSSGLATVHLLTPFWLILLAAAFLANYLQGGWIFAPGRLAPDVSRLNLFSGFGRLFSWGSLLELVKSLLKLAIIVVPLCSFFQNNLFSFLSWTFLEPLQFSQHLQAASFKVSARVVILLLGLGVLDYFYQRYRFERGLRMTRQEVKDELRQMEGDPRVKARIRSLMRQLATRRMLAAVPKADVVVTNPTRLAVALKYDSNTMVAPQVVAKGRGFIALKIIALAREAGVPLVENRELAQGLYRLVEVGETIPTSLYRAVAEVLAYIYRLKAMRRSSR